MDAQTTEQALRCEAIRRRLAGERVGEICEALARSRRWFHKWWAEYQRVPAADLADRSRAPHTSPQAMPETVVRAVTSMRQLLEAAATPDTRYGLIGARAIQGRLEQLHLTPLPSVSTIQRILAVQALTHSLGAGSPAAYYPWPIAWEVNAIHATDLIVRHVWGGEEIDNFHTIDHYSQAAYLSQQTDKTSATTCAHLVATWRTLGLPHVEQLDNEGAFSGGHTHPHILGRVVRLCLFCGIEPLFTPVYDAKRNYQIETFHSLWQRAFWSRHAFRNREHVQREIPAFEHWYHRVYRPPALNGRTPADMQRGARSVCLTDGLRRLLPSGRLPITAGRVHFMRKVDTTGQIELLNETWAVDRKWIGEYVRATINLAEQKLSIWHQADAQSDWRQLKTRQFRVRESVHDLLPPFRRKCARCRDYWPG